MGLFHKTPEEKEAARLKNEQRAAEFKQQREEKAAEKAELKAQQKAAEQAWHDRRFYLAGCPNITVDYVSGLPGCNPGDRVVLTLDEENKELSFMIDLKREVTLPFSRIESIWGGTEKEYNKAMKADHATLGKEMLKLMNPFPEANKLSGVFHILITYRTDDGPRQIVLSYSNGFKGRNFIDKINNIIWGGKGLTRSTEL